MACRRCFPRGSETVFMTGRRRANSSSTELPMEAQILSFARQSRLHITRREGVEVSKISPMPEFSTIAAGLARLLRSGADDALDCNDFRSALTASGDAA